MVDGVALLEEIV